jgi:16S rRNA (guanine966-N2)-methyltransferase
MPRKSTRISGRQVRSGARNRFRIIAGQWRSRVLSFPSLPGLRPTPDRVRETLFNWLALQVPGSRCLDLFCGSGALGLEALSRGASSVIFVDHSEQALASIRDHLAVLGASGGHCERGSARQFLARDATRVDIVFADPPFDQEWSHELCTLLQQGQWLAPGARVYLETSASRGEPDLPPGWEVLRQTRAGGVLASLLCPPGPEREQESTSQGQAL